MRTPDHKAVLRRQLRARRAELSEAERMRAASAARQRLLRSSYFRAARHVAAYFAVGHEMSTRELLYAMLGRGRCVYVPRLGAKGRMRFVALHPHTRLRNNRYGIPEPVGAGPARAARRMDLILLPLLGFDAQGGRLGAGGGYYDRSLAFARPYRRPALLGYAFAFQEVEEVPMEQHDIRLDAVITDQHLRRF